MSSFLLGFDELTRKQQNLTEVTHTIVHTLVSFHFNHKVVTASSKYVWKLSYRWGFDICIQSRDFRRGASHFGELNIEYRACIMATLFWAEFSWVEVCVEQVLALTQMHPKESLGRVIHDSKVVWCLKCGILVLSEPFATVVCQWLIE